MAHTEAEAGGLRAGKHGMRGKGTQPFLPSLASLGAGRVSRASLSVPHLFSLTHTIPCFTMYRVVLHTSGSLPGTLLLQPAHCSALSGSCPAHVEKGSPSPHILHLPHPVLVFPEHLSPSNTQHNVSIRIIYISSPARTASATGAEMSTCFVHGGSHRASHGA